MGISSVYGSGEFMKRIEAIIRPEKLEPLRIRLEEIGYPGMMITEIEGHGKQGGVSHQWRGSQYKTAFLPKIKVEIIAADTQLKKLSTAIIEVCSSGTVGDGKIFISPISDAIRIRTKEKGEKAI
jgi:nitrogen regulatory protein P-II 1